MADAPMNSASAETTFAHRVASASPARRLLVISDGLAVPADDGGRTYVHAILSHLAARGMRIDFLCLNPIVREAALIRRLPADSDWLTKLWSPHERHVASWLIRRRPAAWLKTQLWRWRGASRPSTSGVALASAAGFAVSAALSLVRRKRPRGPAPPPAWSPSGDQPALLAAALRGCRPDAVIVDYTRHAPLLDLVPRAIPRLLLTHDILHQRSASYRQAGAPLDFIAPSREAEAALLRKASASSPSSPRTRKCSQRWRRRAALSLPMPALAPREPLGISVSGRCLFVGGSSGQMRTALAGSCAKCGRACWPRFPAHRSRSAAASAGSSTARFQT